MIMQNSYNQNVLLTIQSTLGQYPILSDKIVAEMYNRLIRDGYISFNSFEERVRDFALLSQKREGLQNPFAQEAQNVWEKRLERVHHTQVLQEFAHRYTLDTFREIVDNVVQNKSDGRAPLVMWHNLQHASIDTIFEQALSIERMPLADRKQYIAQLTGAKVALIRRLITERIAYIRVAKDVFTLHDLVEMNRLRIGRGKIGTKAAGVLLANRILRNSADADIRNSVGKIESICIGADEFYHFMMINNMLGWYDQKYKDEESLWMDYPRLKEDFIQGDFPPEIVSGLKNMLTEFNGHPFIVRSSSLLEDSFTQPYSSLHGNAFIANQGTPEETLEEVLDAIRNIYAAAFNPNVIEYRRKNHLLDYPEYMAIMIQTVQGESHGSYFFCDLSGVAAGCSPYKWKQNSRKDEGFLRFVVGLGSRATQRCGDDFAHIIELSDPNTRHTTYMEDEKLMTQDTIHVLNLKTNESEVADIHDVIDSSYSAFSYIAQTIQDDTAISFQLGEGSDDYGITCNDLIKRTDFTHLMRDILRTLERAYERPVRIEFSAQIDMSDAWNPGFNIQINNCRPVSESDLPPVSQIVPNQPVKRELFTSDLFTSSGLISEISYVVFIDPVRYDHLFTRDKDEFCLLLSEINQKMSDEKFIFAAASRWGTSENNGIPVSFLHVSKARAIVELSGWDEKHISDPCGGTQFFQSLKESGIHTIITNAGKPEYIDHSFFTDSADHVKEWIDVPPKFNNCIRILSTKGWYGSKSLTIYMDRNEGVTRAYFI